LIGTEFKKNVDVFLVFKDVFKVDDVLMLEGFMDFDFRNQLVEVRINEERKE